MYFWHSVKGKEKFEIEKIRTLIFLLSVYLYIVKPCFETYTLRIDFSVANNQVTLIYD